MRILALDTSGLVAGVALLEDDCLLAEYNICYKKTHSQTLLPMLEEVRKMLELNLSTIDGIAIASGPGSFTGLRIGSATAKGLGLALGKPLIEVPTLEGLAYNMYGTEGLVCPIMDARRNQVYTGIYRFEKEGTGFLLNCVVEQCAEDINELLQKLNELGEPVVFLGDGVPVFKDRIAEALKTEYSFAPAGKNRQSAGSVAALGAVYFSQGKTVTPEEHAPEYVRKSQAEREREEAQKAGEAAMKALAEGKTC